MSWLSWLKRIPIGSGRPAEASAALLHPAAAAPSRPGQEMESDDGHHRDGQLTTGKSAVVLAHAHCSRRAEFCLQSLTRSLKCLHGAPCTLLVVDQYTKPTAEPGQGCRGMCPCCWKTRLGPWRRAWDSPALPHLDPRLDVRCPAKVRRPPCEGDWPKLLLQGRTSLGQPGAQMVR